MFEGGLLQALAQGRQVAGAPDEQPSDEPAAAVKEGARVAGEGVAVDLHAVVAGSGAGELQAHAVLIAPEGRRRRRRGADAERAAASQWPAPRASPAA